jgi:hypothetical protein
LWLLLIIVGWQEIYWELLSAVVFLFGGGLQIFLFFLEKFWNFLLGLQQQEERWQ